MELSLLFKEEAGLDGSKLVGNLGIVIEDTFESTAFAVIEHVLQQRLEARSDRFDNKAVRLLKVLAIIACLATAVE